MTSVPVASNLPPPESSDEGRRTIAHILSCIFPKPTLGQDFFQHFVERAQHEQVTLPDEPASVVAICTKSIATLSQELGFSHDTTQKYVVLFKALGLLKKRKLMEQQVFILSTGIYLAPETLEANLDHLILRSQQKKSRGKLHQLLLDVKQRCLVYGLITQDITQILTLITDLLHPIPGETKLRLERRIVQAQYLFSTLVVNVVQQVHHPGQEQVDSLPQVDATPSFKEHGMRKAGRAHGRIPLAGTLPCARPASPGSPTRRLPFQAGQVDSSESAHEEQVVVTPPPSTYTFPVGRLRKASLPPTASDTPVSGKPVENLPNILQHVASRRGMRQPNLPPEAQAGGFSSAPPTTNPSTAAEQVDSAELVRNVNVNINNFFNTFTLREPQKVAEFLAEQLEGTRTVYPKYRKLFTVQPGQPRDVRVLEAAYICTMVHLRRDGWKLDHPGGYFTSRCREYDAGIPQEVEAWMAQYGAMSCTEFLAALTQPAQKQPGAAPSTRASTKRPAPSARVMQIHADPARMVLSKDEADELMQCILQDVRPQPFRVQRVRVGKEQPRYAVLIDAAMPGSESIDQLLVYTQQDWQQRLAARTSWYSLFHPGPHD